MARKAKISRKASATYASHSAVSKALRYAEEVAAGVIPAGQYHKLACVRQLKDLERKRFAYYFDADEAERVISIIQLLPHTKDKWAGKPIVLEPWQLFIFTTAFGWLQKKDGLRRFREIYAGVPRKNGKSLIAAAVGIYMLAFDGEVGAEVYCGATTERQAKEVFKPARAMVMKTEALRDDCGIHPYISSLAIESDGSTFQKVIGTPGDGESPSCAITDEYHEHQSSEQYDTMQSGMLARSQPMHLVITTAGSNYGGPCYLHQKDCERVLNGSTKDDRLFVIIFHADDDDDWSDPKVLYKANPNLGVSVMADTLLAMQQKAKISPQHQSRFRTKHLNQWTNAKSGLFNMLKWRQCQNRNLRIEDFAGQDCVMAIDLASKSDLAAVKRTFTYEDEKGKRHYTMFPRFYLPEDAVLNDTSGKYARWVAQGLIEQTEGNEIDFATIREDVMEDMGMYNVTEAAFDSWRAYQLAQELTAAGANMVEYRTTGPNMSEPLKEFYAAVNGKRLHHDGNEVLTWMAANTINAEGRHGNWFPDKERKQDKIDGIVAGTMTIGRIMFAQDDDVDIDGMIRNLQAS